MQPKGGGDLGLTNLGVDNAPLLIVLRGANPAGEAFYFRRAKGDRTDKMRRKIKTKKAKSSRHLVGVSGFRIDNRTIKRRNLHYTTAPE